jgi:hypothetical protein
METHEFELLFDPSIQAELDDRQIDIGSEIQRAHPELEVRHGGSKAPGAEHQRDVVLILGAVAGLAPLVVPIATELIQRLLPHVETETLIEEGSDGRRIIRVVRKET